MCLVEAFLIFRQKSVVKEIVTNLIFAAIYFILGKFGLGLATLNNSASPVWPATGFSIAIVYLFGFRSLTAVALGALAVNITTNIPLLAILSITVGNTLEALIAVLFIRWTYKYRNQFTYYTESISILGASVIGGIVSASVGCASLYFMNAMPLDMVRNVWVTWWIGDTLGGLVVTPLLIHLPRLRFTFKNVFPMLLVSAGTVAVSYFIFIHPKGGSFLFLIFPLLFLTIHLLNHKYVFFQSAFIAAIAIAATVKGLGPCAIGSLNERLVHLQLFLTMIAITSITLAGIGSKRLSLIPSLVLMSCWLFAGGIFYSFDQAEKNQTQSHFKNLVSGTHAKIEEILENYENVLRGGAGLYTASSTIAAREWRNYNNLLQLTQHHPGMNGIGVIWPVKTSEIPKFDKLMKKDGFDKFALKAVLKNHLSLSNPDEMHYVVKFVEPYKENATAIGLDISTETNRRISAEVARDTGSAVMTSKIDLIIQGKKTPGFHLYFPVYAKTLDKQSIEERRQYHIGWIYSPVTYEKFFNEAFNRTNGEIELQVFEGEGLNEEKIVFSNISKSDTADQIITGGDIGRKPFTFKWKKSARFDSSHDTIVAWVGLCGSIASLLLTCLMISVQSLGQRSRELAQELTKELSDSREKFKEGERRLLYALDGSNDGIWDWNMEKSEMYVSGKIAETFAWPQIFKMQMAEDLKDIAHPDDLKPMTASVRRHVQGLQESHEVETRYKTKNGNWRWVLTRGKISERDQYGNPIRMTGVHIDIDALKRAQELLESTQNQLRHIADSVPTMVSEWDIDLRCKFANHGFADWFDLSPEKISGRLLSSLIPEKEFLTRCKIYDSALRGISQGYEREELCQKTLEKRHLVSSCVPNVKNNKIEGFFLFVQDITELKQAEVTAIQERQIALEATNIKSQFLANMSHEIRTPINGIIGMTNLLKSTNLSQRQREYTDLVSRSSDMLLNLINDILDFSKIEAGKLELEIINFDLNQLVTDAQKSLSFSAQDKSLKLLLENSLPTQSYFKGDPSRLRQIIMNLLSNAIKFTAQGEVTLVVQQIQENKNSHNLRFEVRDTGIGISEISLNRLFQAFSQADTTTSRRFGGTGLGLSICKQLVQLMNGKIGVESKPEIGSVFWFELTLECGEKIVKESFESLGTLQEKNLVLTKISEYKNHGHVLVVEDNIVNQNVICANLELLNYSFELAINGIEALKILEEKDFDLVLMDCQMPEIDGYEVTRRIRKMHILDKRDIPIVALTANALRGDREKCLDVGMNDYLTKPLNVELLEETLKRWIRKNIIHIDSIRKLKKLQKPGRPDLVSNLIDLFFQTADQSMTEINLAIQKKDWQSLASIAHSLKSSSANLGALQFSQICFQLETVEYKKIDEKEITKAFSLLRNEYKSVISELKEHRISS